MAIARLATPGLTGNRVAVAMLSMALAVSLFALQNAVAKGLLARYPAQEVVFFRHVFGLLVVLLLLLRHHGLAVPWTRMPCRHYARAFIGVAATFGFFIGFGAMPLADATATAFATPIFVTVLGSVLLREPVGWRRWTAILTGFAGVLIIVRPGAGMVDPMALVILLSCFGLALTIVMGRAMRDKERPLGMAFHFALGATTISGLSLLWGWETPTLRDAGLFALLGTLGGVAWLLLQRAYAEATASVVAPFEYLHIVWAVGLGFLLWGDVPGAHVALGTAVVIASGLYIVHREALPRPVLPRPVLPRPVLPRAVSGRRPSGARPPVVA